MEEQQNVETQTPAPALPVYDHYQYSVRQLLNQISKTVFGVSSKWHTLLKKGRWEKEEKTVKTNYVDKTGKPIEKAVQFKRWKTVTIEEVVDLMQKLLDSKLTARRKEEDELKAEQETKEKVEITEGGIENLAPQEQNIESSVKP